MRNTVQKVALEACSNQFSWPQCSNHQEKRYVSTLSFRANDSDEYWLTAATLLDWQEQL
jgi:hypothetical protein